MTKSNLRPEAGGDPARSNSTDLKNDPIVTQDGNDFPDAPDDVPDETPQDQPDLSALAAKLGTDTIESGDGLDAVPDRSSSTRDDDSSSTRDDDVTDPRPIFAAAAAIAALIGFAMWRRQRRSRLARLVDSLDVTTVFG